MAWKLAADHPRIRGEHVQPTTREGIGQGSSPHTRGAPGPPTPTTSTRRIIPAYAGSTPRPPACTPTCPDHPRIRGEHTDCGAGVSAYKDHPRIRGEHDGASRQSHQQHGSSPHTRGARVGRIPVGSLGGIIPAYAGSTRFVSSSQDPHADHPRIRGEHMCAGAGRRARRGSSPHTRGAPTSPSNTATETGIIPAYAGSTPCTPRRRSLRPDHPRIRGEHGGGRSGQREGSGSSPHTRGARRVRGRLVHGCGIIPAYAGSTENTEAVA